MIRYEIIASGSRGNAVVIENEILIDAGVPFKALRPYLKTLRLVLLTHEHADHFNSGTVATLSRERPGLRFICGHWLSGKLCESGVFRHQIDRMRPYEAAKYKSGHYVIMVPAVHNVPNCGYTLTLPSGRKLIYITDTNTLDGIYAIDFDLYLVEANHCENEIRQRIEDKKAVDPTGYIYEYEAIKNHLSIQKADEWLSQNMGPHSQFVYMHCHEDSSRN